MSKEQLIKEVSIPHTYSILDAIKKMDNLKRKLLIVIKDDHFYSLISIGDIQRAILRNLDFDLMVEQVVRDDVKVASDMDSMESIKESMLHHRMEMLPILNIKRDIIDVIFWEEIFKEKLQQHSRKIDLPVVIMAGGKGTRLKPITNIIPKALFPIKEKPIIEMIIDRFLSLGSTKFFVSLNYKGDMIVDYIDQLALKVNFEYLKEFKPLGTAGSLHYLKGKINTTFFLTNCDILIDNDYSEIYDYHVHLGNDLTIVAALKHYSIPYGILETKDNGELAGIIEKPDLTYQVNSGMYLIEPHLLDAIPKDEFYHITHLIELILSQKGKIGVYPVSEGSWMDIGIWSEYNATRRKLGDEI